MSKSTPEAMPNIFPFLRYNDAPSALEWLAEGFGFEKRMTVPGPDESIGHAELGLGSGVVMIGSVKDDDLRMKSPQDLGAVTQGIYIYVEHVDSHHARAKAAGAEIVHEPHDTDYGSREYTARDIEGHLWSFGTYVPGATP